jgi:hypothetical protein
LLASYSSDEEINFSIDSYQEFNDNELTTANPFVLGLWSDMYTVIYKANAILEGLEGSTKITEALRKQLTGEAKFVRSFAYFYLTNLYGDVPLITATNYKTNVEQGRNTRNEVYQLIITDLKDAQALLSADYSYSQEERVRANQSAATTLLARTYLYTSDWINAETEATKVIEKSLYALEPDLDLVFKKNSAESILQFHTSYVPNDYFAFTVFDGGPTEGALRDTFVAEFEPDDQRLLKWVQTIDVNNITYFFPGKYKVFAEGEEYSTVLRLAELYLIRAEARAQQDNLAEAQDDINVIRNRASLGNTTATNKEDLLLAIENERKVELFTEHGHRWLDLKRTNRVDDIISSIKGEFWQPTDALYPIPKSQILNSSILQNPGY